MNLWAQLLPNLAIVAITTVVWALARKSLESLSARIQKAAFSVLMAAGVLATMSLPFEFIPGVFLDSRYTLLAIAGYFGGPWGAALPLAVSLVKRISLGGQGIETAIPIIFAATLGGLWIRYVFRRDLARFHALLFLAPMAALSGVAGFYYRFPVVMWAKITSETSGPLALVIALTTVLAGAALIHEYRLERDLNLAQRRLTDAVENMADGMAIYDEKGRLAFYNSRYHEIFPATADVRIDGTPLLSILMAAWDRGEETAPEEDCDVVARRIVGDLGKPADRLFRLGDGRWISARQRPTADHGTAVLYCDVTTKIEHDAQLTALNEQLSKLATTDPLTGLANRRLFEEQLKLAGERAETGNLQVSLLMIDVDFFKSFNDAYGHRAGDNCLRAIAQTVRDVFSSITNATVARYGGEELAVILPGIGAGHARTMATLLVANVRSLGVLHPIAADAIVTVSVGVATSTAGFNLEAELVQQADQALYQAKASGRNRACEFVPIDLKRLNVNE
jgi:diguanylate cyclase (GGDEF)-like protein